MKIEKSEWIILLLLLFQPFIIYSQYESPVRIEILVVDHYTENPLPSGHIELYHGLTMLVAGYTDAFGFIELKYSVTGSNDRNMDADRYQAGTIKPNPFFTTTTAEISQKKPGIISAEIVDMQGRSVISGTIFMPKGRHKIELSVPDLIPGIYFLTLRSDEELPKTFKLMKIGPNTGGSNRINFFQATSIQSNFLFESPLLEQKKATTDFYIKVNKENYEVKEKDIRHGQDATLKINLKRNNKVAFMAIDQNGNPQVLDMMVSGNYFNLSVTTPKTLIMPSGEYSASSAKGFFRPFKEVFEIPSVDTTICIPVEKVGAVVYNIENPDNELLFVTETEDGAVFYYYGLRDNTEKSAFTNDSAEKENGATVTHLMGKNTDKTITTVIFNEDYYPIMWIHPNISIGVRRLGEEFNPGKATHSFIYSASEDTATLNIRPDNLYELIDWLEESSGKDYGYARNFLDNKAGTFEHILEKTKKSGEEQSLYIRAAMAFSTLAASRAYTNYFEKSNVSAIANSLQELKSASAPMAIQAKTIPGKLAGDAVNNALADFIDTFEVNREGMTVPVFLCKGASKYAQICQFMYFTGTVTQCLVKCVVTLDCYTDICMPDVMNVQQAFNIRKNY